MAKEDMQRALEWSIADGQEVVNEVCGVACLNCDAPVILEPGTHAPVAERARVEVIESMDDAEPHEVRIYCDSDCRFEDLTSHVDTEGERHE